MTSFLLYLIDRSYRVVYGNNSYYGKGPKFKSLKGKVKVSVMLSGSLLPSSPNNSHVKMAHVWETCSGTIYNKSLNVPNMFSFFTYSVIYICHLSAIAITCQIHSSFYNGMKKTLISNNRCLVKFTSKLTISCLYKLGCMHVISTLVENYFLLVCSFYVSFIFFYVIITFLGGGGEEER